MFIVCVVAACYFIAFVFVACVHESVADTICCRAANERVYVT